MHPYSPNGEPQGYEWSFPTTWSFVFREVLFFHVLLLFPNLSCDLTGQLWVFSCHLAQWFYLLRWWLLRDCTNQRGANQQHVVLLPKTSDFPSCNKWVSVVAFTKQWSVIRPPTRTPNHSPEDGGSADWCILGVICHHLYKIIITIIISLIIITIYRRVWSFIIIYHHIIIFIVNTYCIITYDRSLSFVTIYMFPEISPRRSTDNTFQPVTFREGFFWHVQWGPCPGWHQTIYQLPWNYCKYV